MYELTRALIDRGHRAKIIFAKRDAGHAESLERCTLKAITVGSGLFAANTGAPEQLFQRRNLSPKFQSILYTSALGVRALTELRDCDALLSHFALPCGLMAGLVRNGRPHHAIVHGSDATMLERAPSALRERFFRGCTSIQCVHPGLRQRWPTLPIPILDAPMGWNHNHFARVQARRDCQLDESSIVITCIARCIPLKGLGHLIDAARVLLPSKNARIWIIGDGPLRSTLAASAPANVRFYGELSALERDRLLAATDIYVQPSSIVDGRTDSAPTALVEAMSTPLPSVVSDVGALPWLAANSAIVVPPGDSSALASALTRLIDTPQLRDELKNNAQIRSQSWAWSELAASIEALW